MPFAAGIDHAQVKRVHVQMSEMVYPFITPVCREIAADEGESFGTGTFITLRGQPYLLTNDHVRVEGEGYKLAHFVGKDREVAPINFPFRSTPAPIDAALARIEAASLTGGNRNILSASVLDNTFSAVEGELLFVIGYPADWGKFNQGSLKAGAMPLTMDRIDLPFGHELDWAGKHLAMRYPVAGHRPEQEQNFLPKPDGLSGSFLWDTKYAACGGKEWSPARARIGGLVFGYRDARLLIVKIEFVREFILDALRHEAAYYRFLETQQAPAGPLNDWLWAESAITSID